MILAKPLTTRRASEFAHGACVGGDPTNFWPAIKSEREIKETCYFFVGGLFICTILSFVWNVGSKPRKTSTSITCVLVEIRSKRLPNASLQPVLSRIQPCARKLQKQERVSYIVLGRRENRNI
jgi:hypothetical protein